MRISDRTIPVTEDGVSALQVKVISDYTDVHSSIPPLPECAAVRLPYLKLTGDYPYRYMAATSEFSVSPLYCRHKNNATEKTGDGTEDFPFNTFDGAITYADCILYADRCRIVQIILLDGSDEITYRRTGLETDKRLIIGSTDGSTFFSLNGSEFFYFQGVLSQCQIKGKVSVSTLNNCRIQQGEIYCTTAIDCTVDSAQLDVDHLYSCEIRSGTFYGSVKSVNKCNLKISCDCDYIYDSVVTGEKLSQTVRSQIMVDCALTDCYATSGAIISSTISSDLEFVEYQGRALAEASKICSDTRVSFNVRSTIQGDEDGYSLSFTRAVALDVMQDCAISNTTAGCSLEVLKDEGKSRGSWLSCNMSIEGRCIDGCQQGLFNFSDYEDPEYYTFDCNNIWRDPTPM